MCAGTPLSTSRLTKQAHIIVGASAKSGIQGLVYRLAGYNPTAEEVIAAFKLYVQDITMGHIIRQSASLVGCLTGCLERLGVRQEGERQIATFVG